MVISHFPNEMSSDVSMPCASIHETVPLAKLGGVTARCQAYDQEVAGSTPVWVTITWLLLGWVTDGGQENHLGI